MTQRKRVSYLATTGVLAIVWMAAAQGTVMAQRAAGVVPPPPFHPGTRAFDRQPTQDRRAPELFGGQGPAGTLDPYFAQNGKFTSDFSSQDYTREIAVQADGKIVAAGAVFVGDETSEGWSGEQNFAVFRYDADGSLDTSFGGTGKVVTRFTDNSAALAVAIQTDGKIVAAGVTFDAVSGSWLAALARYNTDGSLDASFGSGGKVISEGGDIGGIVIQPDGKIVADGGGATVIRYNANGSLDTSFGADGFVVADFGNTFSGVWEVAVQPDGKIIAAGDSYFCDEKYCYTRDFGLARFNPDGSVDASFDADGRLTTRFDGGWSVADGIIIQPDGKIVAAGHASQQLAVARYNTDGSLDTSFDGDGKAVPPMGPGYWAEQTSAALQADGKIVLAGTQYTSDVDQDFALARLNSNGSLDSSFDGDGNLTTDFANRRDSAFDVAIQPNGKIIAGGLGTVSTLDFALSRYNANGSLDTAFQGDGTVTTPYLDVDSGVNAVVISASTPSFGPRIYLVGYGGNGANDDFAIACLNPAANDPIMAKRRTPIGNSHDRASAAAVTVNGRIVAAGYSHNGSNKDLALVRYYPDNLIVDQWEFGQNGKVTTDFGGNNDEAKAIAVQTDGKLVVVGQTSSGSGPAALVVVRYNDNGSVDTTFGTGGSVIVPAIQDPTAILIQPDGKIIAGGKTPHIEPPYGDNFALARFNPDGSLDTSFSGDGIAVTRFDFSSQVNALAFRPQGKIVAAGFSRNDAGTVSTFALASYNADGSPDISFNGDGKVITPFAGSSAATGVRVQRNGRIVAVGVSQGNPGGNDFALARFKSNGSLDPSYGTDGRQTTDFFGDADASFAAAIDYDNRIIAAGSTRRDGHTDFAAARYLPGSFAGPAKFDFDGDGRSDVSVFRPSNSQWYVNRSSAGFTAFQFGLATDKLTPADYDGDGKTDVSVYRDGTWFWLDSSTGAFHAYAFGLGSDVPLPGDYTGDGRDDLAVFRGGAWYTHDLLTDRSRSIHFGIASDLPVPADYDGDAIVDPAVFRGGVWHILMSTDGYFLVQFGIGGDQPVPADYHGDGKADPAVYRNGMWYWRGAECCYGSWVQFGYPSDTPAPADYDGDGDADKAVFRNGTWHLLYNEGPGGYAALNFGQSNDKPVPAAFLP